MKNALFVILLTCLGLYAENGYCQQTEQPVESKGTDAKASPIAMKKSNPTGNYPTETQQKPEDTSDTKIARQSLKVAADGLQTANETTYFTFETWRATKEAADIAAIAAGIAALVALVASIQVAMFWIQLKHMKSSNDTAAKSAQATLNQSRSQMLSERAYVKISHSSTGIVHELKNKYFEVKFEIKNWGRTPATVTDVNIAAVRLDYGTRLPKPFDYRNFARESWPNGFLVEGELMDIEKTFPAGNEPGHPIPNDKQLWIYGHVDYIDIFRNRWRGGYARKYIDRTGNNLVYNTEDEDNFDRPRNPDEGSDWTPEATAEWENKNCPAQEKRWKINLSRWPLFKA